MSTEMIENWVFNRKEAAKIVDITEGQISNWLDRYRLFPHKQSGTGRPVHFSISDLMLLAAMDVLIRAGIEPKKAAEALVPYGGIYRSLLHDDAAHSRYPGTMFLTQNNDGRWVGADTPTREVAIEIRAWPIFERIYPQIRDAILADPGALGLPAVREAIAQYERAIADLFEQRWGRPVAWDKDA